MTNLMRDHDAVLNRFSEWLAQTSEEVKSLNVLAETGFDDETVDDARRNYLQLQADQATQLPSVGLLQLAEAFTALRHEIKLQTRGSRNLEAVVEQSLSGLESASKEFRCVQAKEREAGERAAKPVVEALISLDEGLLRAAKAFRLTCDRITASASARIQEGLNQAYQALPPWKRWLNHRWYTDLRAVTSETLRQSIAPEFANLLQGFSQIQSRLTQSLQDLGVERLHESGGMVDPSRMTVIDIVESDTMPPETVVEVVRPGYSFGGRVIRFAEVRATIGMRSSPVRPSDVSHSTASIGFPGEDSAADQAGANSSVWPRIT